MKSQLRMGEILSKGLLDVKIEKERALQWFLLAAMRFENDAVNKLGTALFLGDGIEQDQKEACDLWNSIQWSCVGAELNLAYAYETGQGVKQDINEAISRYIRLGHQNVIYAQKWLAETYENGREGVPKNLTDAVYWYDKLADQGDPEIQHKLASLMRKGYGRPSGERTAFHWDLKAAEKGILNAQINVGKDYLTGREAPDEKTRQDWAQSGRTWLKKVIMRGHSATRTMLADHLLFREDKINQEKAHLIEAAFYFRINAGFIEDKPTNRNIEGWYGLAWCYREGIGVGKSLERAALLFQALANDGYIKSQKIIVESGLRDRIPCLIHMAAEHYKQELAKVYEKDLQNQIRLLGLIGFCQQMRFNFVQKTDLEQETKLLHEAKKYFERAGMLAMQAYDKGIMVDSNWYWDMLSCNINLFENRNIVDPHHRRYLEDCCSQTFGYLKAAYDLIQRRNMGDQNLGLLLGFLSEELLPLPGLKQKMDQALDFYTSVAEHGTADQSIRGCIAEKVRLFTPHYFLTTLIHKVSPRDTVLWQNKDLAGVVAEYAVDRIEDGDSSKAVVKKAGKS